MIPVKSIDREDCAAIFQKLNPRMNMGDAGRVLVVCGSYDKKGLSMCGAAYFAAKAAYLCGAGVVEVLTPRENYAALASLVPEAVFSLYGYEEDSSLVADRLRVSVGKSDAVVLGCGLGKSDMAKALVKTVFENVKCPLVIDADGLNILSENEALWSLLDSEQRKRTVITPHPGEMSRLTGKSIGEILDRVPETCSDFASEKGIVCLLKDHNTAISDGETVYINQTGNPGMATAGMGDVLAGIIGALLARSTESQEVLKSVAVSAYLHGLAGDIAARRIGEYSLTASELLAKIPSAVMDIFSEK